MPENYDMDVTFNDSTETIRLKPYNSTNSDDYVCRINDTYYSSIKAAVEAINENSEQEEIIVIKPIYSHVNVDIPSNKNVKINLSDNYLYSYASDYYFKNDGSLYLYNANPIPGNVFTKNNYYSTNFIINNNNMTSDNFDIRKYNQDYNGGVIVNNGTYNYNSGNITLSNKNFISSKESEYSA